MDLLFRTAQSRSRVSPAFGLLRRHYWPVVEEKKPVNPEHTYIPVVESAEDFKYVQKLLPPIVAPPVPVQSLMNYPTPSGWIPAAPANSNAPYFVGRSRIHGLPVYMEVEKPSYTKKFTKIKKVQGDIWQFEKDLIDWLRPHSFDALVATQVSEVNREVRIKGDYMEHVKQFLLERGF
ncbi:hypothetical protein RvY_15596 [Ramazzottius varieornatus]|uniref:Large ribosomal subunit protein mL49 n=1 Tax=Ramazzottius varieornatus TaxID=947166 RepID=A0A1D1VX08_RAMVA|nr:hypothetical protein RvY_15596 [Ramazzottius varieornatus]